MRVLITLTIFLSFLGIYQFQLLPKLPKFPNLPFGDFVNNFDKKYATDEEEKDAENNYIINMNDIKLFNANPLNTYTQGINQFTDMKPGDAISMLCGIVVPEGEKKRKRRGIVQARGLEKSSMDWRDRNAVSAVRDQEQCGSCWAFAAAQAIEGRWAMENNRNAKEMVMSEQQLVDCSTENSGCNGGWPQTAYEYVRDNGLSQESCYSYKAKKETCSVKKKKCSLMKIRTYVEASDDEVELANELANEGPMSVAIHVDNDMMKYKSGIYTSKNCNKQVNHGVLLVGYGTDNGLDYWTIKNSWGTSWGESGFMRIARNKKNMCKIASYAAYPVVK